MACGIGSGHERRSPLRRAPVAHRCAGVRAHARCRRARGRGARVAKGGAAMKPVTQSLVGEEGNCFAACVASILEMSLVEVPNFCAVDNGWWAAFQAWLAERGLCAVDINIEGQ